MPVDNRPGPDPKLQLKVAADERLGSSPAVQKTNLRFTRGQVVATVIESAGFRGDNSMLTMLAVAHAESMWNFTAKSPTNDWGLFQINKSAWPDLFTKYQWNNPLHNAVMAREVYNKQGIKAWSTYNNGAYRKYVPQAQQALKEYKQLTADHRLAILEVYKGGTPLTRAAGFGITTAVTAGKAAAAQVGDAVTPDNLGSLGGAISGLQGALSSFGNNLLGIIVAIVLLILGVVILLKMKGK